MALLVRMLKPAGAWLLAASIVGGGAAWLAGRGGDEAAAPGPPGQRVEVPVRPLRTAGADAHRVTVTVRWGFPAARDQVQATRATMQWDGYLALDCGDIERVEPLGLEPAEADDASDLLGPVVRGENGDQRVYWRSRTGGDWDGLRVQVSICTAAGGDGADPAAAASSLRIVTPQRTYVARLDWSVDDFSSMRIGNDGSSLDVHISAVRDFRALRGARVTSVRPAAMGAMPVVLPVNAGKPEFRGVAEGPVEPEVEAPAGGEPGDAPL